MVMTKHKRVLTQHAQLGVCSDVVVPVGGCAAVTTGVVVCYAPDQQIASCQ